MKKVYLIILFILVVLTILFLWPRQPLKGIIYGVSFSKLHASELELDWKKTYIAVLDDLGVRNLRLSAHWPNTEPIEDKYNFADLDYQMKEAQKRDASVILAVGRRLPGWPECHDPDWILKKTIEERNDELLEYMILVVNRYKAYKNIKFWQVENEPYLAFFSRSACGELDEEFLKKEIASVKQLDPTRPILITDSGEFGTWYKAYQGGDVFGTSMYLYIWWRNFIGPLRYPITPEFFRIKHNLTKLVFGDKPSIVIELSTEPWLLHPIPETPIDAQLDRMGIDKFNEMLSFSSQTSFDTFYLWGAEWWYWMKEKQNHPEFWNRAKEIF